MVATQLQRMSMVPRMEGEATILCGSDEGMVHLGLVKVRALTRVVDRAKAKTNDVRSMALLLVRLVRTLVS